MVQVNRVCLNILFINRPQFLVDSNDLLYLKPLLSEQPIMFYHLFFLNLQPMP